MRLSPIPAPLRNLKYALWVPIYLLCFAVLERLVTANYWPTQTRLDGLVPFCEWFVIPYCLWYPLLIWVGICLLLRDGPGFRRYMRFLAVTFFVSALLWLLIPNGQDLRPAVMPRDNALTRWIAGLYAIDTNTNVFPSVHVVGAVGAVLAVWSSPALRSRRFLSCFTAVLAAVICLSTLLIKQHTLLDVAGGLVLSCAVGAVLYCRRPLGRFRPMTQQE